MFFFLLSSINLVHLLLWGGGTLTRCSITFDQSSPLWASHPHHWAPVLLSEPLHLSPSLIHFKSLLPWHSICHPYYSCPLPPWILLQVSWSWERREGKLSPLHSQQLRKVLPPHFPMNSTVPVALSKNTEPAHRATVVSSAWPSRSWGHGGRILKAEK